MKLSVSSYTYRLLFLSAFIFASLCQAQVIFRHKFATIESKNKFAIAGGDDLIHKYPEGIYRCGRDHLCKKSIDKVAYQNCIEAIKMPDSEFKTEILALDQAPFASKSIFEDYYQRALIKYAMSLDPHMKTSQALDNNLEFHFNFLALLIVPAGFAAVYFLNKHAESRKKTAPSQAETENV